MKAIADEVGEESVEEEESGKDEIREMTGCWFELFAEPRTHFC